MIYLKEAKPASKCLLLQRRQIKLLRKNKTPNLEKEGLISVLYKNLQAQAGMMLQLKLQLIL